MILENFLLFFAYTQHMQVGGSNRTADFERLGPCMVIAASMILAIRTAYQPIPEANLPRVELENDIEASIRLAKMVLARLVKDHAGLFQHKDVPWYTATDEDLPK